VRRRTFLGGLIAAGVARPAFAAERLTAVVGSGLGPCLAALEAAPSGRVVLVAPEGIGGALGQGLWARSTHLEALLSKHGLHPFGEQTVEALRFADGEIHPVDGAGLRALAQRELLALDALDVAHPAATLRDARKWLRHQDPDAPQLWGRPATEGPLTPWRLHADAWAQARLATPASELDAGHFALAERFHALDRDAARVRWLRGEPEEVLWGPLREALGAAGVEIVVAPIAELQLDPLSLALGRRGRGVAVSELELGWNRVERVDQAPVFVRAVVEGVEARVGRCPRCGALVDRHAGAFRCTDAHALEASELPQLFADLGADGIVVEGELPFRHLAPTEVILDQRQAALCGSVPPRQRSALVVELLLERGADGAAAAVLVDPHASHALWLDRVWGTPQPRIALQLVHGEQDDESALRTAETAVRRLWPELADVAVIATRVHRERRTWFAPGFGRLPRQAATGVRIIGDAVMGLGDAQGWEAVARSLV